MEENFRPIYLEHFQKGFIVLIHIYIFAVLTPFWTQKQHIWFKAKTKSNLQINVLAFIIEYLKYVHKIFTNKLLYTICWSFGKFWFDCFYTFILKYIYIYYKSLKKIIVSLFFIFFVVYSCFTKWSSSWHTFHTFNMNIY